MLRRKQHCPEITETDPHRAHESQFLERLRAQPDGIVEERPQEVDTRFTLANQHDCVAAAVAIATRRDFPALSLISDHLLAGFTRIDGHVREPPVHHAVALGKKAVSADVDPIAFVVHRSRDPAHVLALFEHDGHNVAAGEQFISRGQSRRSCPDNYCCFLHQQIRIACSQLTCWRAAARTGIAAASPLRWPANICRIPRSA